MNKFSRLMFGNNKIAEILIKYKYQIKIGDILGGKIIGIERKEILVDLGFKQIAFLPNKEVSLNLHKKSSIPKFKEFNKFHEFMILSHNFKTNLTVISLRNVYIFRLWERFKQLDFNHLILFTKLQRYIRSGKLVKFDELYCFIPNFHVPKYYRRKKKINHLLPIKILKVKNRKHMIIGSSRLAFFKKYSSNLHVGLIQKCYVTKIKPYGIFLNIYGFRSLLHISEISYKRIKDIKHLYKKGDQITVKIIYINSSNGKVALSKRKLN